MYIHMYAVYIFMIMGSKGTDGEDIKERKGEPEKREAGLPVALF